MACIIVVQSGVAIAESTILGIGVGVAFSSANSTSSDVTKKLLQNSLNTIVFAYILVTTIAIDVMAGAVESSKAYVESIGDTVKDDKEYKDNSVYLLKHPKTLKVHYVGITNDPWRRSLDHKRSGTKETDGEAWVMYVVASGLTRAEARAMEQSLICIYTIDALANARYEIAQKNYSKFEEGLKRAANLCKIPYVDLKNASKRD